METYFLKDDIKLLCVNATSFPEGIEGAHQELHKLLSSTDNRKVFGISRPDGNRKIIYKAGVEEAFVGEGEQLRLETFVLKKGEYKGARIVNYPDHLESITKTFEKILKDPKIDPQGCCVEMYLNEKDLQCMVRLESKIT
jgi:hypothetical protein